MQQAAARDTLVSIALPESGVSVSVPIAAAQGLPPVEIHRYPPGFEPFVVKAGIANRADPAVYSIGLATQRSLAARQPWSDYRYARCGSTGYLAGCQFYESSNEFIAEYLAFVGSSRLSIAVSSEAAALRRRVPPIAFDAICDSLKAPFDSAVAGVRIEQFPH